MARAHSLKNLSVNEISLVDAPANPHAHVLLYKRKDAAVPDPKVKPTGKLADGSPLDRLLTRLGLAKRARPETIEPDSYADAAAAEIDKATTALAQSLDAILADSAITDKAGALEKSLAQFRAYTIDATSEQIDKAMRDVALIAQPLKDDPAMPTPEEQIAALSKQLADAQIDLAKAKMSAKHAKFMAGLGSDDAKSKFAAKSPDERDSQMGDDADDKDDKDDTRKGLAVELSKAQSELSDMHKRLISFEAERELESFRKRSVAIGLAPAQAETILKASKGDAAAFDAMLNLIKAANAQAATGAVFREFGSTHTGDAGSAAAEVGAAAEVMMKAQPGLSVIAARVAVRKANAALAQRERDEERVSARAVS